MGLPGLGFLLPLGLVLSRGVFWVLQPRGAREVTAARRERGIEREVGEGRSQRGESGAVGDEEAVVVGQRRPARRRGVHRHSGGPVEEPEHLELEGGGRPSSAGL